MDQTESPQQIAEEARRWLSIVCGLTHLSNIEFVGLRIIAAVVLSDLETNTASSESMSEFGDVVETARRFLYEFYDIHTDSFFMGRKRSNVSDKERRAQYHERDEKMKEYLRMRQEQAHRL